MKYVKHFILAIAVAAGAFAALGQGAPFMSQGTTSIAVTGTAQALTLAVYTPAGTTQKQLVLTNVGTQTVFIRWDATTVTVANGMPLLANSQVVVSVPVSVTATGVIAAAVGSTLYATVGGGQ